jgi:hypothetical protein
LLILVREELILLEKLGKEVDEEQVKDGVLSIVKLAFIESGADFNKPTKANLAKVVCRLAEMSQSWGTPKDIVEYHKKQIEKVISML